MCFSCWKRRLKSDDHNLYVRLKDLCFPCFGGAVINDDFQQENTNGKMSQEEFRNLNDMITAECNNFSEVKCSYFCMILFLVGLHFVFPRFLIFKVTNPDHFTASTILPMALFLLAYSLFMFRISKSIEKFYRTIQKILRNENCSKYINRGLCWRLDPKNNYLHLNLRYSNNQSQYLISEALSTHSEIEEFSGYLEFDTYDLENGGVENTNCETRFSDHLKNAIVGLGILGGLAVLEQYVYIYLL